MRCGGASSSCSSSWEWRAASCFGAASPSQRGEEAVVPALHDGPAGKSEIQMQPVRRIACSDRSWCARIGGTDGYGLLRSVVAAKMGQARLSMPAWTLGRNGRIRTTLRIVLPLSSCGPARITCCSPAAARDSELQREGCGTTAAPFPAGCLLHTRLSRSAITGARVAHTAGGNKSASSAASSAQLAVP